MAAPPDQNMAALAGTAPEWALAGAAVAGAAGAAFALSGFLGRRRLQWDGKVRGPRDRPCGGGAMWRGRRAAGGAPRPRRRVTAMMGPD